MSLSLYGDLVDKLKVQDIQFGALNKGYLEGRDLDLAVFPDDGERIANLIFDVASAHGGAAIVDYTSSGRIIRLLGCQEGQWWGAAIDLFSMMEYRGVEYIKSESVIRRAADYRGIRVARNDDAAVIALVKELLSNAKTRKSYFPDLAHIYKAGGRQTLGLMRPGFSASTIELLGTMLEEGNDHPGAIATLAGQLRVDVFKADKAGKTEGMLRNLLCRLRRIISPPGFSIAVLGTDGSGKSTLIEAVTPILERALHSELQYEHLRPNWLPALGVAARVREKGDGSPETNPHGQRPSGWIGSLARLGYYVLDYTLGYWIRVYPKLVKRPHICLFDRYYYDFIIDPRRMRINLPRWVLKAVLPLIPKPNLILCLGAEPEKIFARKPETSLEEVARQVSELKELCRVHDSAFWVDTGGAPEQSAHEVLTLVKGAMASRYY